VTRRPGPSGRGERSSRTQKDDDTVESTPVFRKASAFAGGRWNGDLGQHEKSSTIVSQKERRREARRKRLQIFRGNGLVTRWCSAGIARRGAHANAGPFTRLCRPGLVRFSRKREHAASLAGSRWIKPAAGSFRLVAGGSSLRRRTSRKRRRNGISQEITASDAGEGNGAR